MVGEYLYFSLDSRDNNRFYLDRVENFSGSGDKRKKHCMKLINKKYKINTVHYVFKLWEEIPQYGLIRLDNVFSNLIKHWLNAFIYALILGRDFWVLVKKEYLERL